MNKFLLSAVFGLFCLESTYEFCHGLKFELDLRREFESWGDYFATFLERCLLHIPKSKLDKSEAQLITAPIKFAIALTRGNATDKQWRECIKSILHERYFLSRQVDPVSYECYDILSAELYGLLYLIKNNIDELPETSHQLAKQVERMLEKNHYKVNSDKKDKNKNKAIMKSSNDQKNPRSKNLNQSVNKNAKNQNNAETKENMKEEFDYEYWK